MIYYGRIHANLVPHVARVFENSFKFHRDLFDYTPTEKVTVLLHDYTDHGNAGARSIPNNFIHIGVAPFSYAYETVTPNERMNWILNHELVHIVASDRAAPSDKFFRSLFFGKVSANEENPISMLYSYLTNPRDYSPRWYHEGIAVFLETWMAGGFGRAQGGYDEMVFRAMVLDSSYIYDLVGLESEATKINFQVGLNSYLYGTRFMSYLAYHYGPENLVKWIARTDQSKTYFASEFRKIYGVSLDDEWSQWVKWEHQFQQANLDSIRLHPTTPYRAISRRALGSVSRAYYDSSNRKLYAAINYPGQVAHIASIDIDDGEIERLHDVKGAALFYVSSLAYDASTGTLFYTTDNNDWRDLRALDVKTGDSKTLLKDARVGDLAFNQADKSIWAVRHFLGISTLVRIPYPYTEWNQILSWPYGKDIYDIDISPDGSRLVASLAEISGRQTLIKMDVEKLMEANTSYDTLFDFGVPPANFVFSPDGRYLFGTSYSTGVSNIWRYDVETEKMDAVSNCETGFFRPLPLSDDSLLVFRYTGKGFVPVVVTPEPLEDVKEITYLGYRIQEKYPIVRTWNIGSPLQINIDSVTTSSGEYKGLQHIKLASAYPIIEKYKDFAALGMRLNFAESVGIHNFDLSASYSPNRNLPQSERLHMDFNYGYWGWTISAALNHADFYDLFGPTKTSRKGYSLSLQYKKTLLYDEPKTLDYSIRVDGHGGLERLPDFQNVRASFDKFLSVTARINYKNLWASLGAVEYEKGYKWQAISSSNYVNRKAFPRIYTNFDYGFALPINHSSIWVRSSFGYSIGERDEPFANFYFGGFGNNWVDHLTVRRYREYYSFPGSSEAY